MLNHVKAGGDDGDQNFAVQSVVQNSSENDIGIIGNCRIDDIGCFLNFVKRQVRSAGD